MEKFEIIRSFHNWQFGSLNILKIPIILRPKTDTVLKVGYF